MTWSCYNENCINEARYNEFEVYMNIKAEDLVMSNASTLKIVSGGTKSFLG